MEVRLIKNKELLESVEMFKIENLLWGTEKIAKRMGILDSFREMDYISNWCVRRRILSGFIKKIRIRFTRTALWRLFSI